MERLKSLGTAVWVGILGFLAFYAATSASRNKRSERHWQDKAVGYQQLGRDKSLAEADAALDRADKAAKRAEVARQKTEKRLTAIARKDDEMADIVARWTTDGMRDRAG